MRSPAEYIQTLRRFLPVLLLSLTSLATSSAAVAQSATIVEIGTATLDREKVSGSRWERISFDPLISGTHTIRITWDSDADIRFSLYRIDSDTSPGGKERIATISSLPSPAIWTGALDVSEKYYLGVWSASGAANFIATLETTQEAAPVVITNQPSDITVPEGEDATFSVAATGSGALTYQWFSYTIDNTDDNDQTWTINPPAEIPGATSDTLTIDSATITQSLTAYSVDVSNESDTAGSEIAILTVDTLPLAITSQPEELTVTDGQSATFSVAVTGGGTTSYQWFVNTTEGSGDRLIVNPASPIPDATNSTLTLNSVTLADNNSLYSVEVSDNESSETSTRAILNVEAAPQSILILEQPTDLTVTEGNDATFEVAIIGNGTLQYQWFADSKPIIGATADTLTIRSTTLADSGTGYSVEISDGFSSIDSAIAILVVEDDVTPPITIANIGQGTLDADEITGPKWTRLAFESLADAVHTITLSWDSDADVKFNVLTAAGKRINTQVIQGSNPGVWVGDLVAGEDYYLALWTKNRVANYTATIEATVSLAIKKQPADLIVAAGNDATFFVESIGSNILSYQWFAGDKPIAGETSSTLTVYSTSLLDNATEYSVEVSNGNETLVSASARLTVNETTALGLFTDRADTSAWMLQGPAPTLDYRNGKDGWGRVLLRIDDTLLVGGDFQGIKPSRHGPVTSRPFLAALNAVSGKPNPTFQVPAEVNSVVRSLVRSPDGSQVYIGGDFGFLVVDAISGELEGKISVIKNSKAGRVFDIAVTNTQLYVGGDFTVVNGESRRNLARFSLDRVLDTSWNPSVTGGFSTGRAAPVQTITISPKGDTVYVGGTLTAIDGIPVDETTHNKRISMLSISASDGTILPERFSPDVGNDTRGVTAHDIVVTESYVIIAWGGPNFLTFHSYTGERLRQYLVRGDVQVLQVVGDHVIVGHHGEFFGSLSNANPPEAVISTDPQVLEPFKLHSFRIDDPSFPAEQSWAISGTFGVWGIAATEDSLWIAGQISKAGSNMRPVDGLARFKALD